MRELVTSNKLYWMKSVSLLIQATVSFQPLHLSTHFKSIRVPVAFQYLPVAQSWASGLSTWRWSWGPRTWWCDCCGACGCVAQPGQQLATLALGWQQHKRWRTDSYRIDKNRWPVGARAARSCNMMCPDTVVFLTNIEWFITNAISKLKDHKDSTASRRMLELALFGGVVCIAGMVALIAAIEAHGPSPSKLRRLNLRGNNLGPASVEAFWAPWCRESIIATWGLHRGNGNVVSQSLCWEALASLLPLLPKSFA